MEINMFVPIPFEELKCYGTCYNFKLESQTHSTNGVCCIMFTAYW